MLSTKTKKVVFAYIFGFLLVFIFSWRSGDYGEICEYNNATNQKNCTAYEFAPFICVKIFNALNDYGAVITALATIAIALFTYTLWASSEKMWRATEKSAAAAEQAAQAAIGVELPRLFATKIEFAHIKDSFVKIAITITNYGRTPAFVTHESAEFLKGQLPRDPKYLNTLTVEHGTVIEGGDSRTLIACGRDHHSVLDRATVITPTILVWVYGRIWYRDFLNNPHELGFCSRLHVPNALAGDPKFIQDRSAPAAYTAALSQPL